VLTFRLACLIRQSRWRPSTISVAFRAWPPGGKLSLRNFLCYHSDQVLALTDQLRSTGMQTLTFVMKVVVSASCSAAVPATAGLTDRIGRMGLV
jgi:hypothetical protein